MIKALVLDFDGLILDTAYPEYYSWLMLYSEYELPFPISLWSSGGFARDDFNIISPYDYLEAILGRPVDRAAIRIRRRAYFAELMQNESVLPGVRQILSTARVLGLGLAVASNSPREWVTGYLKAADLVNCFDILWSCDDVTYIKPNPWRNSRWSRSYAPVSYERIARSNTAFARHYPFVN